MFQYTHELVLNSINEAITKFANGKLTVERGGEYVPAYVQGGVVWQSNAVKGALDKITLKVAGLGLTAGKNYALNMFVKLVDPHALFEYGYPNYNSFGKQILVDFKSVDAATDAHTILDSILPQVMENDLTFVKGVVNTTEASGNDPATADVVLEVGHFGLRFDSIAIAEYAPTGCDTCIGEYLEPVAILDRGDWSSVVSTKLAHDVEGKDPFATGEWLIENLRFPSYPNIRWAAIGESNRPVPGEVYTMFSFAYESPRPGLGGVSGVGQKMEAVTRHIYYVRGEASVASSPAGKFKALLANLGTVSVVAGSAPSAAQAAVEKGVAEVVKALDGKKDK